ncbi:MAG: hypothetical protein HY816_09785 [Candidatus Wallbacteria bacterium]|nr:hypothetical protein [Candidatus Wallbacteria bacterium]
MTTTRVALAIALAIPGVAGALPPTFAAGGIQWRLEHEEVELRPGRHVLGFHYRSAPSRAPSSEGAWMSVWATYRNGADKDKKPVAGTIPGLEKVFDRSEWREDQVEMRREGVERVERRRYIQAERAGVCYEIWPQKTDPVDFLVRMLTPDRELGVVPVRYIAAYRVVQADMRFEEGLPEPDPWDLRSYDHGMTYGKASVHRSTPVTADFLVREIVHTYLPDERRTRAPIPVAGAEVELRDPSGKRTLTAGADGWVRLELRSLVQPEAPEPSPAARRARSPRFSAKAGDYELILTEGPPDPTILALPAIRRQRGPQPRIGCVLDLPPRR